MFPGPWNLPRVLVNFTINDMEDIKGSSSHLIEEANHYLHRICGVSSERHCSKEEGSAIA